MSMTQIVVDDRATRRLLATPCQSPPTAPSIKTRWILKNRIGYPRGSLKIELNRT